MSEMDAARPLDYERSKFDYDLRRVQPVENSLAEILNGLGMHKVEMKHDYQAWQTGRVFVETRRRNIHGDIEPSGLSITEADIYIQSLANRADIYILDVSLLRHRSMELPEYQGGDGKRSLGVLIPIPDLRKLYPRKLWAALG